MRFEAEIAGEGAAPGQFPERAAVVGELERAVQERRGEGGEILDGNRSGGGRDLPGSHAFEEAAHSLDDEFLPFARQNEIQRGVATDARRIGRDFGAAGEDDQAWSPLFQERGNLQSETAVPDIH